MKKLFYSFVLVAAAAMTLVSCNKEVENPVQDGPKATHTVKFVASIATKTAMTEGAEFASFSWTEADAGRIKIYEDGVASTDVEAELEDGAMTLYALFDGEESGNHTYVATLNGSVPANQVLANGKYDECSDVLVSKPVSINTADLDASEGTKEQSVLLQFKRVVALNKVTFSGFGDADTKINSVVISSETAQLAGTYDVNAENPDWIAADAKEITLTPAEGSSFGISNQTAVVYFNSIPTDAAKITFTVTTDKGTYTRTAKSLTLEENKLNTYTIPLKPAPLAVENFSSSTATNNMYDCSSNFSETNIADFDFSWTLLDGTATVFQNGIKLGSGKKSGTITSDDILESVSAATIFTVKVYAAGWNNDKSDLSVSYNGKTRTQSPSNSAITATTGEYSSADFSISTDFVFIKADGAETLEIASSDLRVLIDKIEIVKGGELPAVISVESVSLNKSELSLLVGQTSPKLVATVLPENADNKDVIWSSDNESIATVEDGVVTAIAAGDATITVTTVDGAKTAICSVSVTTSQSSTGTWSLVTDANALSIGDQVVIASAGANNYAISTTQNTNNRSSAIITKSGDNLSWADNAGVQIFTLEPGTKENTWSFKTDSGYINASSSSSNHLKTEIQKTDNSSWTIGITDGVASIVAKGTYTRNILMFNPNNGTPIFACYGSATQTDVAIYQLADSRQVQTLSFPSGAYSVALGDTFDKPNLAGALTTVTYSSSNTDVATVASDGSVNIIAAGTTTITATAEATDTYRSANASYTLTVTPKVSSYESLDALVAAGTPTAEGELVNVTLTDSEITGIYTSGSYRNGIFFMVDSQEIELYYRDVPSDWAVGGKVSGILVNCPWKLYNSVWELAPAQGTWGWNNLTYSAPVVPVAPVLQSLSWTGYTASYSVGGTFVVDGTIKAVYNNGTDKELSASEVIVVTAPNLSAAGSTSAVISYTEGGVIVTATANISVTAGGSGTGSTTKTFTFENVASNNSWQNAVAYTNVNIEGVNFVVSGAGNNGKYYTSDRTWRFYSGGGLKISVPGATITKVESDPLQSFTIENGVAFIKFSATVKFKSITVTY